MGTNVLKKKCWVVFAVQHYVSEGKYYITPKRDGGQSFYSAGLILNWTDYIVDLDGLGYIIDDITHAKLFTKKEARLFIDDAITRCNSTFFKGSTKDLKNGTCHTDRFGLYMEKISKDDMRMILFKKIL